MCCVCPLAKLYVNGAANKAGDRATELAASHKETKCASIGSRPVSEPIAVETISVFNSSARLLLNEIGKRICFNTGKIRETSFLFQSVSMLV